MCHVANFAGRFYEIYDMYQGKQIRFDSGGHCRVVPSILPSGWLPNQSDPVVYRTGYELYGHLGTPESQGDSD